MTQSLGKNKISRYVPRRHVEKHYFTTTTIDLGTSVHNSVMKKGDGGFLYEGEYIRCSGGGDTAITYENRRRRQGNNYEKMVASIDGLIQELSCKGFNFGEDAGHNRVPGK